MIPLPKLLAKAQVVFNGYIRARDAHKGCISCGSQVDHAGHYFSAGHYSALRFSPINVNGQCLRCNNFLHGNLIQYRKGLIARYGVSEVEKLELFADLRKTHKWCRTELDQIIITYKNKKNEIKSSKNV